MTFDELSKPKSIPCARCGSASEAEAWGIRICYRCHAEWMADERFSSGVINAALGVPNTVEQFTTQAHVRYCAEATKRTQAWAREPKARVA